MTFEVVMNRDLGWFPLDNIRIYGLEYLKKLQAIGGSFTYFRLSP
jgi:hypothetical protein